MLIRHAEIWKHGPDDLRIEHGKIMAIGRLEAAPGEQVIDASGGALLPGLHDHHIHLAGLAARESSVWCGPPQVTGRDDLIKALSGVPGPDWIRGIGYHESVLGGLPSAPDLDEIVANRPLRMQHRSGRMWLLNSRAVDELLSRSEPPDGLEREGASYTGRLFDGDEWLRGALASSPPDFANVSRQLASRGVTGVTDMTPQNGSEMARHFSKQMVAGSLMQHCVIAGQLDLADAAPGPWQLGPAKLHLHEAALPEFDAAERFIQKAHNQNRGAAIHCVTEVELVFALAALESVGVQPRDRVEHASVASPELIARMSALGLTVCVQPHFVEERGDLYLAEVEARHQPDLYRLRTFIETGIPLVGGSDAPFGGFDPWAAMAAATSRQTAGGEHIRLDEALSPADALALYLADPQAPHAERRLETGAAADICLLDRPWSNVREDLRNQHVALTIISGRIAFDRVDQSPIEGLPGV